MFGAYKEQSVQPSSASLNLLRPAGASVGPSPDLWCFCVEF